MFTTIILVVLIFLSYRFQSFFQPLKTSAASMFVPMQKGITVISSYIEGISDNFEDVENLQKKYDALQSDYDALLAKYNDIITDSYELETLRALFQISETYSQYDTVGANIIASDTTGYNSVFTIDKGSDDGMKVDMNVIAGFGLVGIITEVGPNYSVVRSIIDDNTNVSATILKSSDSCIVSGNIKLMTEGYVEVTEIPLSSEVKNNYQVVTSSLSSKYLPDILIGYISNVTVSADGLSMNAHLTPVVDFAHLKTVLVVTTMRESEVTEAE